MISKATFIKLLSNFFLISLMLLFFLNFLPNSLFVNFFIDLGLLKNSILIFSVVSACLFFYSNKYEIEKIDMDLKNQNDLINLKKDIFSSKHQILNKIPFLNYFFKWFYKNGFIYSLVFVLICVIWFSNIFVNLWKLPFHQDEVFHFSPAVTYNKTWEFAKWDFLYDQIWDAKWSDRNKSLTILTSYSQRLFWLSEFSSRLPVAIIWFIWIFLIYFISIKITSNRIIWLIAIYIYSVNDVILYFSWFLRAYIFLIILCLVLFYLLYRFLLIKDKKIKLIYAIIAITIFTFWLVELHWTIIVLLPFLLVVFFIWIIQIYSIKKHYYLYTIFFIISIIFILNTIWIIDLFKMPFWIQEQVKLKIDFFKPEKIYLYHLTNPFNIWFSLIFLLISLLFINFRKNFYLYLFLVLTIYIPLIFSLYFFNRYEDFRYISLISWIFIIYISIFIFYTWRLIFNNKNEQKYIILILWTLLFTPFQFPNMLEVKPFTKTAQSDWQNIEWSRLHFRAAQPDNYKAFDYIFENFPNSPIVRLPDGWLNWDDNYYLSKYIKSDNWKKIIFYNNFEFSTKLVEVYNFRKRDKKNLNQNEDFFKLLSRYKKVIIIWNNRDLVDKKIMDFLNINCKNIAWEIWIVQYRIFEYAHPINNYFPNVFVCENQ